MKSSTEQIELPFPTPLEQVHRECMDMPWRKYLSELLRLGLITKDAFNSKMLDAEKAQKPNEDILERKYYRDLLKQMLLGAQTPEEAVRMHHQDMHRMMEEVRAGWREEDAEKNGNGDHVKNRYNQ